MYILTQEKKLQVLSALLEGCSIRSVERLTGVHRDSITRLMVRTGESCEVLLNEKMRDLSCRRLECDEIWTYVSKKQKRLNGEDNRAEMGDQYLFVALDADTKLVPSFVVGKRDGATAYGFMLDLQGRLSNRVQITTDGFPPYRDAVEFTFGPDVDFSQLVKVYEHDEKKRERYSPSRIISAVPTLITGKPNRAYISTSFVERNNLTIRMQMRRFTRLTNAFSKKLRNLKAAVALHFAHYNLVRIHRTLRVTPAMAAGVSDHIWSLQELISIKG